MLPQEESINVLTEFLTHYGYHKVRGVPIRSFYERAVDNGGQTLPINHPILEERRRNLDRVKKKL